MCYGNRSQEPRDASGWVFSSGVSVKIDKQRVRPLGNCRKLFSRRLFWARREPVNRTRCSERCSHRCGCMMQNEISRNRVGKRSNICVHRKQFSGSFIFSLAPLPFPPLHLLLLLLNLPITPFPPLPWQPSPPPSSSSSLVKFIKVKSSDGESDFLELYPRTPLIGMGSLYGRQACFVTIILLFDWVRTRDKHPVVIQTFMKFYQRCPVLYVL